MNFLKATESGETSSRARWKDSPIEYQDESQKDSPKRLNLPIRASFSISMKAIDSIH